MQAGSGSGQAVATEGSLRFSAFLAENKIGLTQASRQLAVSASTIFALRNGTKRPKATLAAKIRKWTKGRVREAMWLTLREAEDVAGQRPFARSGPEPKLVG